MVITDILYKLTSSLARFASCDEVSPETSKKDGYELKNRVCSAWRGLSFSGRYFGKIFQFEQNIASARESYKKRRYYDAIQKLDKAIEHARADHIGYSDAALLRAFCYIGVGDVVKSAEDIDEYLDGHPFEASAYSWYIYNTDSKKAGALISWLGHADADQLFLISDPSVGLLDPVDDTAYMLAYAVESGAMADGRLSDEAVKVLGILAGYVQKMSRYGYGPDAFISATQGLNGLLINNITALLERAEKDDPTANDAAKTCERAYEIAVSAETLFRDDVEILRLKSLSARRLAAQITDHGRIKLLYGVADACMKEAVKLSGGLDPAASNESKKDIVIEYAIAKSEYAKFYIDNEKRGKKEEIQRLLGEAQAALSKLKDKYPGDLDILANYFWVVYRRGKLLEDHSQGLREIKPVFGKIISSSATSDQKSEFARLYMWLVLEEAKVKIGWDLLNISQEGVKTARGLFLEHGIKNIISDVEKYTTGERWKRDKIWGKYSYSDFMGIMSDVLDNGKDADKWYADAMTNLDELKETEHRSGIILFCRGDIEIKTGHFKNGEYFLSESLKLFEYDGEWAWKTRERLKDSIWLRTYKENPGLDEKNENILRIVELAMDNVENCRERDQDDAKYMEKKLLPAMAEFKKILCGADGEAYRERAEKLLGRALKLPAMIRSAEFNNIVAACKAEIAAQ